MPTRPRYTSESQNLPRRVRKELVAADQKTQPTTVEWNSDIVFEVGAHCCLVQRDGRVIVFMCREEHTSDYSNHPMRGHMRNYFWTQISPSRSSSDSSSLSSSPDSHTFPTSPPSHHPYFQQSRYASEASTRHGQSSSSSRPASHRAHSYAVAHAPNGHALYDNREGRPEPAYPFPSAHGYIGPPGQGQKSAYTTYASPSQQGFPTEQDYAYPGTEASVSSHGRRHTSRSDSRGGHDPRVETLHQNQRGYAVAPGQYQTHLDVPLQQSDDGSRRRHRERYV